MTISQLGLWSPVVLHDQETRGLAESIRSLHVVADPDIELRGRGRFFVACPAGLSSFCDFFSPKIRGARAVTRVYFCIISTLILPTLGYRVNFKQCTLNRIILSYRMKDQFRTCVKRSDDHDRNTWNNWVTVNDFDPILWTDLKWLPAVQYLSEVSESLVVKDFFAKLTEQASLTNSYDQSASWIC